jgi:DNA-binding MarR family transcriptional regulator
MDTLARSFKAAMAAVRRLQGRDTHRPGALSQAQYQVLFELLRAGELPAGELAAVADVSPASMTQMLDRLADGGLVERVRSEQDRRIVVSRLSPAGRAVCEQRRAAIEPLWRDMLQSFTAGELHTAAAVLDRLTELFERLGDNRDDL